MEDEKKTLWEKKTCALHVGATLGCRCWIIEKKSSKKN